MSKVDVYVNGNISGRLGKSRMAHVFSYQIDAPEAISLTMPVRTESYTYDDLHPIFQMNLPEGHLRNAIERATAKQYGSDDLTLLAILGSNQIGRIGYSLAGEPLSSSGEMAPDLETMLGSQDANLFDHLLQMFATSSGVAGVQPKVLVEMGDKATLPLKSYIVKSWGPQYPELACNEFVCMTLAREAGLNVAEFFLSDNGKLFVSKRFDLTDSGEALGFEDFCVLKGLGTKQKYDVSLESCVKTIRQYVSPDCLRESLYDFFKLTLLNVIVRNGDAHLKNIGVVFSDLKGYQQGGEPSCVRKLAPVFDIVSTVPYISADTMALTLAGTKRWPKWKALEKFAKQQCELNNKEVSGAVDEVVEAARRVKHLPEELGKTHSDFQPVGEIMEALLRSPITQ